MSKTLWAGIVVAVLTVMLGYLWSSKTTVHTGNQPVIAETPAPSSTASPQSLNVAPPSTVSATQLQAAQQQVAQVVAEQPLLKPIVGEVQARPSFVSEVEWSMLQATAQQSPAPSTELTHLVNTLRFHKMLDVWQNQPATTREQQHDLAAQLLQELPEQFKQGHLPETQVRQLQEELVMVAEATVAAREARLQHERQRLHEIKQQS